MESKENFLIEQYKTMVEERGSLIKQNFSVVQLTLVGSAALYAQLFSQQSTLPTLSGISKFAFLSLWYASPAALLLAALTNWSATERYRKIESYLFEFERSLGVLGWETFDRGANGTQSEKYVHKHYWSIGEKTGIGAFIVLGAFSLLISIVGSNLKHP